MEYACFVDASLAPHLAGCRARRPAHPHAQLALEAPLVLDGSLVPEPAEARPFLGSISQSTNQLFLGRGFVIITTTHNVMTMSLYNDILQ